MFQLGEIQVFQPGATRTFPQVRPVRLERVLPLPPRELLPMEPAQFRSEVMQTELQRAFPHGKALSFAIVYAVCETSPDDCLGKEVNPPSSSANARIPLNAL